MKRDDLTGKTFGRLKVLGPPLEGYSTWWRCQCVCGKEHLVHRTNLLTGHTKSCGCLKRSMSSIANMLPPGVAARNDVIREYRRRWKRKGSEKASCSLTDEQIISLLAGNCFYCGSPPCRTKVCVSGTFVYNGIDRLDNDSGYRTGNVVSCCTRCNFKKGTESFSAFVEWVIRTSKHLESTRDSWPKLTQETGVLPLYAPRGYCPSVNSDRSSIRKTLRRKEARKERRGREQAGTTRRQRSEPVRPAG